MVARSAAALEDLQRPFRFLRGPLDDFAEDLRGHLPRAGTGDEQATRREQPDRAVIDLLVDAQRAFESFAPLGERRWIEHDDVELAPVLVERPKLLDGVR